jgi:serine/threonine protein kinase/outer membrane protein assembly factor BamD (BamD/ComL family)
LTAYGSPLEAGPERRGERDVKLGRYEIVRELGKGAMGVVYLAKDPLIGRLVALKTIRRAQGDDEDTKEFQQRFIREAQAAGILNHPAIVTVHDIGQDEPSATSFIAMEYVEGSNLKEILSQGRPLSFDEIGDIIAQVADALDFAHSKGIVHRDVKPANIILVDGNRAKITDFGIAKIASGGNLTTTGQFLGTPNYMAPEQIRGAPVDGRTDIFSLGICLYECLTRRKPFGGESLTSISYKIVHEPFPPIHEINPQIPDGYEEVVALALAKDPTKRYQRGRDFALAVRAVVRGERPARQHEPMLEEATVVTHDRDKLPTIEMPFPEASGSMENPRPKMHANPHSTMAAAAAGGGAAAAAMPPADARPILWPRARPAELMRKTLDGVRALPLWRTFIPPAIFFSIVGVFVLALVIIVASIRSKQPAIPKVDTAAEAKVARERLLRTQGNQLLRLGRVIEAFQKFEQLSKLRPSSPYVSGLMAKMAALRQVEEGNKQQLVTAKQLFDEGMVFFNNKQYPEAIKAFEESFHLNPNSDDTANYLKLAQQEDDRVRQEQAQAAAARGTRPVTTTATRPVTTTHGGQTRGVVTQPAGPAQITTHINAAVTDGYIMVKVGGEVVAHENLWQETGRFLLRRRVSREVTVTKEITPKNADVDVWVVIPALNIQDHRTLKANFLPGVAHRLNVSFDPQSKTFTYQLN